MFTPLRKGWSLAPRSAERNGSLQASPRGVGGTGLGKEKGAVSTDTRLAAPHGLSGENGADVGGNRTENEAWKKFNDAGMLDVGALELNDREALFERTDKLENELYEYQYNMGLLLIEKKEWTSKYDKIQQGLIEAEEILKREKAAHLIAVSEMEKREDNLRKALSVEKQCVTELEKALRELRSEHADVKVTADRKLTDAQALKAELQEKSLEVCAQIRSADVRLAEISRKNSDVERKLQELATRESVLQRERLSLNNEKELHAEDLARQREDMQAWEKSLHEGHERLVESQSLICQREKRTAERDKLLTNKEKEIEMLRESTEKANNSLKEKEDYINMRLTDLAAKNNEMEFQMENLQKREQELLSKEELANDRERVEIEKIVADHKTVLASRMQDFELELAEKRKLVDEELKNKLIGVEKREKSIKITEEKLLKREQALEKKIEKLNNSKKDLDAQSKSLKKWEDVMKQEKMKLEKENKQLSKDNEQLSISRAEIDDERKVVEAEKVMLILEQEKLKVTEQEREELVKLQSELKEGNDECVSLRVSYVKELDELREERKNFEREWEILDEKRSVLSAGERMFSDEKAGLEKWKRAEELRLETEKQVARDEIQRETDDLRLKKEAFEANMEHDRSELVEKLQQERADMIQEFDLRKHELESDMQRKLRDLENQYQKKEMELNEQRMMELDRIRTLREFAASEMQKMKIEQVGLEREKEEYLLQRKKLKEDQIEIQKDIEMLRSLSRNLKDQREEFVRARKNFLNQNCTNCGVRKELVFPAIVPSYENGASDVPIPCIDDGYLEDCLKACQRDIGPVANDSQSGASGSPMSWLKACTRKIFNLPPQKRTEISDEIPVENSNKPDLGLDSGTSPDKADEMANPTDLIELTRTPVGVDEVVKSSGMPRDVLENSINRNEVGNHVLEILSEHNILTVDGQNELSNLSPLAEDGIAQEHMETQVEPQRSKENVKHGGRRGGSTALKRKSVQAAVESKALLVETCGKTAVDTLNNDVTQGDSVNSGRTTRLSRKRHTSGAATSEMVGDGEARSDSIAVGGRQKRRQVIPETKATGKKRYNFRRSTIVGKGGVAQTASGKTKGAKTRKPPDILGKEPSLDMVDEREESLKVDPTVPPTSTVQDNDMNGHMHQRSMVVHESSSQKIVELVQEETIRTESDTEYSGQIVEIDGDESASVLAEQEDGSNATEEGGCSDNGDEESDSEKHNASMGKKLWKFFTS